MEAGKEKVFNIVKAGGDKKKNKLKKEKKYEFLLVGRFLGPKQADGAIACRVVSSVFETYFDGYTPVSFLCIVCSFWYLVSFLTFAHHHVIL